MELFAQGFGIAVKAALPEAVADEHGVGPAQVFLLRSEVAAKSWRTPSTSRKRGATSASVTFSGSEPESFR